MNSIKLKISIHMICAFLSLNIYSQVRVGLLYSLSGTMAVNERPLLDVALYTINEINKNGGVNGKVIIPVIKDTGSNWEHAKHLAKELIEKDKVSVIFGCWTSACRKAIKPVVESYDNLLFYSLQYEGIEESSNIIYTGPLPNQQIIPGLNWMLKKYTPKNILIIGSEYVFPKVASEIVKNELLNYGTKKLTEIYIPLGSSKFDVLEKELKENKYNLVVNLLNGSSNFHFFKTITKMGYNSGSLPTISFSLDKQNLKNMDTNLVKGYYLAWPYFEETRNHSFIKMEKNFKTTTRYSTLTSSMISTYVGVLIWEQAVKKYKTVLPSELKKHLKGTFKIGHKDISITNNHLSQPIFIGKINKNNRVDIVWKSKETILPQLFLNFKSKPQWRQFLRILYTDWDNRWEKSLKKNKVKSKRKINIYASRDLPYLSMDLSKYKDFGILGNQFKNIFNELGFAVQYVHYPKNRVVSSLVKTGNIAFLPLSECQKFPSKMTITKSLGVGRLSALNSKEKLNTPKISQMRYGLNQSNFLLNKYYEILKKGKLIKVVLNEQLLKMLINKRLDRIIIDENSFYYLIGQNPLYAFKFGFNYKESKNIDYGLCFSDEKLRDQFNQTFEKYTKIEPVQFPRPTWRK